MEDTEFIKKVETMFQENLTYTPKMVLRVKNIKENKVFGINDMNYGKIRFDHNLNIYKFDEKGEWVLVNNDNFKAIVVEQIG